MPSLRKLYLSSHVCARDKWVGLKKKLVTQQREKKERIMIK